MANPTIPGVRWAPDAAVGKDECRDNIAATILRQIETKTPRILTLPAAHCYTELKLHAAGIDAVYDMVERDSKTYFDLTKTLIDHPGLKHKTVHRGELYQFVKYAKSTYDVIILDLTGAWCREHATIVETIKNRGLLNEGGLLVYTSAINGRDHEARKANAPYPLNALADKHGLVLHWTYEYKDGRATMLTLCFQRPYTPTSTLHDFFGKEAKHLAPFIGRFRKLHPDFPPGIQRKDRIRVYPVAWLEKLKAYIERERHESCTHRANMIPLQQAFPQLEKFSSGKILAQIIKKHGLEDITLQRLYVDKQRTRNYTCISYKDIQRLRPYVEAKYGPGGFNTLEGLRKRPLGTPLVLKKGLCVCITQTNPEIIEISRDKPPGASEREALIVGQHAWGKTAFWRSEPIPGGYKLTRVIR